MEYYYQRDLCPELEGGAKVIDVSMSNIRKLFKGAKIFITGGAGFLGSLLIEKIARSCPDFGKIYLLLRSKRGLTPAQRLDKILENEIFNKLKTENPGFISRVFLMEGDLNESHCGLSEDNLNIIRDEVNIIFHNAACLRMTEPLKSAYYMNVRATKDLLDLGTEMKDLKAFVYTSTAYSNCFRPDISETFYPTTYNWENLRDLVETTSEDELTYFTPKLVGPWVNTYAFTKAIAEDMIKSYVGRIPVAIARPSIIIGCTEEPLKCWINSVYGAVGVTAGASVGIIRVWYTDKDKIADLIPADYVVNTMIAIALQLAKNQQEKIQLKKPIFNIVSSPKAPTTWGGYMNDAFYPALKSKITTRKSLGEFAVGLVKVKWLFFVLFNILHLGQGLIVDTLLYLNGKTPQLIKGYIKIMRFNVQLAFFCEREWKYEQQNVDALLEQLTEEDKQLFPFDMTSFNWKAYHEWSIRAIMKYIIKSKDCENPKPAHDHYYKFMVVRQYVVRVIKIIFVYGVVKISQMGLSKMIAIQSDLPVGQTPIAYPVVALRYCNRSISFILAHTAISYHESSAKYICTPKFDTAIRILTKVPVKTNIDYETTNTIIGIGNTEHVLLLSRYLFLRKISGLVRAVALVLEDDEDDDFTIRRPRWIRQRTDDFNMLDDIDFSTRYRLSKSSVLSVLEQIEGGLEYDSDRVNDKRIEYMQRYREEHREELKVKKRERERRKISQE